MIKKLFFYRLLIEKKQTNPEDEYDEKYNSKENQDDGATKKYMRCIPRKK